MKIIAKSMILAMSVGALSMGTSLWGSSLELTEEVAKAPENASPVSYSRKDASIFSFQTRVPFGENREFIDEPAPVRPTDNPPSEEELAWRRELEASRLAMSSESADSKGSEEKKPPKSRRKSVKEASKKSRESSPMTGRRRAGSGVKKDEPVAAFLSASSSVTRDEITLLSPTKVTFVEEADNEGPVMEAAFSSPIEWVPEKLSHDEVKKLLAIPLGWKAIKIGSDSTVAGDVALQKESIQGGLASHKLPSPGVQRIADILLDYPDATAELDVEEKRHIHTLSEQGFDGFFGHYYLVHPTDKSKLAGSNFTIAFARKK